MGNKSSLMLRDEEIKKLSDETGFSPIQIEKLYSRFAQLDRGNLGSLSRSDLLSIPELAINPLCERLIQMFFSQCEQGVEDRINFKQFVKVLAAFKTSSTHYASSNPNNLKTAGTITKKIGTNHNGKQKDSRVLTNHASSPNRLFTVTNPSKSSLDHLNQPTFVNSIMHESLSDKLFFVFKIYDADNDGRISFADLRSILKMMVGNYIEDVQLDKIATRAFVEVDQDSDGFIEFDEFCRVFAGKDLDDKLRVRFFS